MEATTGLRERKKQQTREAIVRAALGLFAERGFEATTVADIAAAAGIAPRTFFGYFDAKEDVVFHELDELLARFEAWLADRGPDESAFDAMRAWLAGWLADHDLADPDEVVRRRLIRVTPALEARERTNLARFQAILAGAVAQDLGVPAASLRPHLVAAAAAAALDALERFHDDDLDAGMNADRALAVMDEAIVFLRGGLEALRRHPPS